MKLKYRDAVEGVLSALMVPSGNRRVVLEGRAGEVVILVKGGRIVGGRKGNRRLRDAVEMVDAVVRVLRGGGVNVSVEEVRDIAGEGGIPAEALALHVAAVMDEIEHFKGRGPFHHTFVRVKSLPDRVKSVQERFVVDLANRFGVGVWIPVQKLLEDMDADFVGYLLRTAPREILEEKRRYGMQGRLYDLLKKLVEDSPDIIGVVVSTFDGLPISFYSTYSYDPDIQAAISSAIVTLSENSVRDADLGDVSEILIVADKGKIFLYPMGDMVLGVLADRNANTGMIFMKARKALDEIREAAFKETELEG